MDIVPALTSFADKFHLTYSGAARREKLDGTIIISLSYALNKKDYENVTVGNIRSALQKISITGMVFIDVFKVMIVKKTTDTSPINDMYRFQVEYRAVR